MKRDNYLESAYTGNIYKVMDNYLLKLSPWKDGEDRRVYEYDDDNMHVITYQNACMIVNKQFNEKDERWEHNGKRYKASQLPVKTIDEHVALMSMLPSHYIKESVGTLKTMPNGNSITIQDDNGNEFKMVKHQGKIYFMLLVNEILPKVQLYSLFGQFCKIANIKNVKPIFDETNKRYI